jgi:nitrite reductase/ring-hydroxylating ferredoxin subunit/uncharacterized membrane protein
MRGNATAMKVATVLDRVERATALDRPANIVLKGLQKLLPQRLSNALHGVWLGHPFHPAVVVVPLGSWLGASVLDLADREGRAAEILIGVGAAGAVPAAAAGLTDWASLSPEQRRVGLLHAVANTTALGFYVGSLVARRRGRTRTGRKLAYAGLASAGLGGFIGGHLSYRQASAVNHAAPYLRRIPDGWHDVCAYDELTPGKLHVGHVADVPILVTHTGGTLTAMIGFCGHETGPLGEGEITNIHGDQCVVCPWHGSTFRLSDGAAMRGPAASSQPVLRSRVSDDGRVQVSLP